MKKTKVIVIFSSHLSEKENNEFIEHVNKTIGVPRETYCYPNFNEFSLSQVYNKAIDNHHKDNAIMVFCHNDIEFKTKDWGKKLLRHFNNPANDYQIIGVAGSKEIPEHGCWYLKADGSGLNMERMYGKVIHDNGVREYESKYSDDINGVEPVVTIDGLFMAVDTSDIEHRFDENYGMWHYYDMGFCFPNYLDGCNVGVITDIRVKHKSVGITDEEWEKNRVKFANEYENELPIFYSEPLDEGKLRVLITCQFFNGYTGSEMSVFETARALVKNGHEVHVLSQVVGDPLASKALKEGVKQVWSINRPPVHLRKHFDILHLNHKPISEAVINFFNRTPAVMHVRSEVIPTFEEPVIHDNIKKYISIRDTVTEHIKTFGISDEEIIEIDNPIDSTRFNTEYNQPVNEKKVVLFVGTLDHLRKNMLFDMAEYTKENDQVLWIIGKNNGGYVDELLKYENVKYYGLQERVEKYMQKADYSVGIFRGRTTIEGWLCGNPSWIYYVDKEGNIENKEFTEVPEDVHKYTSEYYYDRIINLYENVLR